MNRCKQIGLRRGLRPKRIEQSQWIQVYEHNSRMFSARRYGTKERISDTRYYPRTWNFYRAVSVVHSDSLNREWNERNLKDSGSGVDFSFSEFNHIFCTWTCVCLFSFFSFIFWFRIVFVCVCPVCMCACRNFMGFPWETICTLYNHIKIFLNERKEN